MTVCHCMSVREHELRRLVRDGARTPRALARATGAGTRCGACRRDVCELLERERSRAEAREELPLAPAVAAR